MQTRTRERIRIGSLATALIVSACVSAFNQQALDFAVDIKAEALALMDNATSDFADHAEAASGLRQRLDAALAHASERSHNEESIRQWELMADPTGNLLGGFLTTWEQRGRLSSSLVEEKKIQVGRGFDLIADTENAKKG